MSRPDFTLTWAASRPSIPPISAGNYAAGWDTYLGPLPPLGDDHDYVMNLQDKRAVWLGGQMLKAVGHEWQADATYDAFAVVRSPVNGQIYRSLVDSNINNEPSVSGAQWALGISQSNDLLNTARIDVASAGTVNLTTAAPSTRNIRLTGSTTVNQFTVVAGQRYLVQVGGSITISNNANIVTSSGSSLSLVAGDSFEIISTADNVVSVAQLSTGQTFTQSLSANGWQRLPSGLILQWGSHAAGSLLAVTFPIAFPNAVFSVVGTATTVSDGDLEILSYDQYTTSGFRANGDAGRYFAVGH